MIFNIQHLSLRQDLVNNKVVFWPCSRGLGTQPHRKLTCPLKRDHVERKFHLNQPPMFRVCFQNFQRGIIEHHLLVISRCCDVIFHLHAAVGSRLQEKIHRRTGAGERAGQKTTATSRAKACGFTVLPWLYSRSLKICHPTESINGCIQLVSSVGVVFCVLASFQDILRL